MGKKKLFLDILKYTIFSGVGIGLFLWYYRDQDIDSLWRGLAEFKYGWILASLGVALLSHFLRAIRWRMLIKSIGYKPGILNTYLSILVMYLANYAFFRMGEVARCGILKRYEGVPFTSQLGTVFIERVVDFLFLVFILLTVLLFDWNVLIHYFDAGQTDTGSGKFSFLASPWFAAIAIAFVLMAIFAFLFWRRLLETKLMRKILSYGSKFLEGIKSVVRLRNPILFIMLTFGIYGCYFLMTWFVMLAFGPTAELSLFVGLAVLAFGSVGMVLPAPGGIGTYHAFVVNTLLLYGITKADGLMLALVLHGSTTIFLVFIGAIALALLPIINRRSKEN